MEQLIKYIMEEDLGIAKLCLLGISLPDWLFKKITISITGNESGNGNMAMVVYTALWIIFIVLSFVIMIKCIIPMLVKQCYKAKTYEEVEKWLLKSMILDFILQVALCCGVYVVSSYLYSELCIHDKSKNELYSELLFSNDLLLLVGIISVIVIGAIIITMYVLIKCVKMSGFTKGLALFLLMAIVSVLFQCVVLVIMFLYLLNLAAEYLFSGNVSNSKDRGIYIDGKADIYYRLDDKRVISKGKLYTTYKDSFGNEYVDRRSGEFFNDKDRLR